MPRSCTICTHPERAAIERAMVAGVSYRHVASQWQTSTTSLQRHRAACLSADVVRVQADADDRRALDVVQQLRAINAATLAVLTQARATGKPDLVLRAVDRVQKQIELQAKLLGDLDERPQINVLLAPEWLTIRAALLTALRPHPAALASVSTALLELEAG